MRRLRIIVPTLAPIALLLSGCASGPSGVDDATVTSQVDHIIYAAPDLEEAVADLERRFGVRAIYGGEHPGGGTRNALVSLGDGAYLEILAPDPAQGIEPQFGVGELTEGRLLGWAARANDFDSLARLVEASGGAMSDVMPGSRARPDGVTLRWRAAFVENDDSDGLVPFFISWGDSEHPSTTSPGGIRLIALRAEHPEPDRVRDALIAVGIALPVTRGAVPALIATIETADGRLIEMR